MQEHIIDLVQKALKEAGVSPADLSCIAYTKVGRAPSLSSHTAAAEYFHHPDARFSSRKIR